MLALPIFVFDLIFSFIGIFIIGIAKAYGWKDAGWEASVGYSWPNPLFDSTLPKWVSGRFWFKWQARSAFRAAVKSKLLDYQGDLHLRWITIEYSHKPVLDSAE